MYRKMAAKLEDPFAAAVAGYFLLKVGQTERVGNMAENFYNWVRWLPDSALIYAWQLMSRNVEQDEWDSHVAKIKQVLLEGVHRGVPIFSFGQRFLFEQLRRLAGAFEKSCRDALALEVERLGARLGASDDTRFMTTFSGTSPGHPATRPGFVEMDEHCVSLGAFRKLQKSEPSGSFPPKHLYTKLLEAKEIEKLRRPEPPSLPAGA
jgi:hypothetical protein